jgi:hypothetical protein
MSYNLHVLTFIWPLSWCGLGTSCIVACISMLGRVWILLLLTLLPRYYFETLRMWDKMQGQSTMIECGNRLRRPLPRLPETFIRHRSQIISSWSVLHKRLNFIGPRGCFMKTNNLEWYCILEFFGLSLIWVSMNHTTLLNITYEI